MTTDTGTAKSESQLNQCHTCAHYEYCPDRKTMSDKEDHDLLVELTTNIKHILETVKDLQKTSAEKVDRRAFDEYRDQLHERIGELRGIVDRQTLAFVTAPADQMQGMSKGAVREFIRVDKELDGIRKHNESIDKHLSWLTRVICIGIGLVLAIQFIFQVLPILRGV